MILNYNSTTYQLISKTTENGETWVVGDTGVKTLKIYFTGITAVNVDNYECIAIMERADGTLSNNILATPVSTGYYKIITNEWICGIEGTLEITVKLRQSDGVGGYNTTTFGLATIDIAEGNLPGDDTITDAQYQALLTAINTATADGITNLNYELDIPSMLLTDIDQIITVGAYQFFYHDVGDAYDKKGLLIISDRDGDFLDEMLILYNAIMVRTYDVGDASWSAWTSFTVSQYKAYIDGLLLGTQAVDKIKYNISTPATSLSIGETRWNDTERTQETKLTENVVARHNRDLFVYCQNKELVTLNAGTPVYISGSYGYSNIFYIKKADNDDYLKTSRCFGITSELIPPDSYGFVCVKGIARNLNTSSFTIGDVVYLGSAGTLTNVRPTKNVLALGVVLQKSGVAGSIAVNSVFFPRPEDLSTVNFTGLANGDAIIKTTNGWANQPVYTKSEADSKFVDVTGGTMVGELAMDNNKITGLADGTNDQDAATIKNLDNHDESETAHLYIRELVQDLENEKARLDGRGKSYGEIPDTTAYLLSLDQATRNGVITGAIIAGHGGLGYTPSNADLVYDVGVGDGVGYHEWEYNGENWVDNGMLGSGKASNDLFGYIKGDGTYLSVVSGLVQVLKSDYATKLGTSGANYTYTDIYNALADRYTKSQTDALLDALKTAFGWEQTQTHSRTYTSADTFPYETIDYSELSLYDYALITLILDNEYITQMIRVDANIVASRTLFSHTNGANTISIYMDANNDYVLILNDYSLTPGGSHTLKLQIDGIKIKSFDASLVGYTNTTSGLTADDVQAAIDEIDGVIDDVLDGTTAVNKATNDANGDQIDSTYEKVANKITTWQETPDDTHYPSEKLVDDRFKTVEPAILKNAEQDLRLATIEENLRKSMAGEVTGTADGTAIVSLGKDVANAPLKVEVDGGLIPALENLVTNGGFSDGTTNWIVKNDNSITVNNKVLEYTFTTTLQIESMDYLSTGAPALETNTDVLYYHLEIKGDKTSIFRIGVGNSSPYNGNITTSWTIKKGGIQSVSNSAFFLSTDANTALALNDKIYLKNVHVFNLTASHGVTETSGTAYDNAVADIEAMLALKGGYISSTPIHAVGMNKRVRSVGKNLFDKSKYATSYAYKIPIKQSTAYVWSESIGYKTYDINQVEIASGTAATLTTSANAFYIAFSGIASVDAFQLEYGSTATTYEAYVSSDLFLQANAVGYKLPNGVADKIRYDNGAYVLDRYVQEHSLVSGDMISFDNTTFNEVDVVVVSARNDALTPSTDADNKQMLVEGFIEQQDLNYVAGGFLFQTNLRLWLFFPNGTYADLAAAQAALAGTKIWYQLATPLLATEILSSGNLNGYQNGTVYVDDVMQDADIYGTNASVSNINYPIKTLEKIVKINSDGSQTNLSVSSATVASGGLSFTHTSLTSGDKVWFSYVYDVDDLFKSKTTVTFYDNKNVVSGSGTTAGKVYKIVPTVVDDDIVWTKVEV